MPNISNISIFGGYQKPEDQVTVAFLHILNFGGENLLHALLSLKNITIPPLYNVMTQYTIGKKNSIPDGYITSSLDILFESKIKRNAISQKQLNGHLKQLHTTNYSYLIYITPDFTTPRILSKSTNILWYNWQEICDFLSLYTTNNDQLKFYYVEFEKLLIHYNVIADVTDRVLIVGGKFGEPAALKHFIYVYQGNRTFQPCSYIAFYHNNKINYVFKIINGPILINDLTSDPLIPVNYLQKYEPYYNHTPRNIFVLDKTPISVSVTNNKKDKNGNPCAFIQSHTYTTLQKIQSAQKTSQL